MSISETNGRRIGVVMVNLWLLSFMAFVGICCWYGPSFVASLPAKFTSMSATKSTMMPEITPFQQMLLEHRPEGSLPFTAVSLEGPEKEIFVSFNGENSIQLLPLTEFYRVGADDGVCVSRTGCTWLCFVYKKEDGWHVVRESIGGQRPVVRITSKLSHEELAALLKNSIR